MPSRNLSGFCDKIPLALDERLPIGPFGKLYSAFQNDSKRLLTGKLAKPYTKPHSESPCPKYKHKHDHSTSLHKATWRIW